MRFVEVNPNDYKRFKTTKNLEILNEFIDSGYAMVMLDGADKEYVNAESCVSSLTASIKRFKKNSTRDTVIDGKAYLMNLDLIKKGDCNEATED